jgi:hypothetical protein
MTPDQYLELKTKIIERGFQPEIDWASNIKPCTNALDFSCEHAFIVANSGMKAQIARQIHDRVWKALIEGRPIDDTVFRNKHKRNAIQNVFDNRERLFAEFQAADDKLAFVATLPYIGPIIKFHLAKNFGVECCKPDRHLVRIAALTDQTPDEMCRGLSEATGDKITLVDTVVWRAANLGLV